MMVPFDQLPDTARVWIYPANRSFSEDEIAEIKEKAEVFWSSGRPTELTFKRE